MRLKLLIGLWNSHITENKCWITKIRINILENISHAEKVMPQMKQSVPRQRPAVW